MKLRHVALTCSAEENADRLFVELLGLKKSEPKRLAPALAAAIFGTDAELVIINYLNDRIHFEVFIGGRPPGPVGRLDHVCLEVEEVETFLQRCRGLGMKVVQVPRGDALLTFIRDLDGNLFEIKGKGMSQSPAQVK